MPLKNHQSFTKNYTSMNFWLFENLVKYSLHYQTSIDDELNFYILHNSVIRVTLVTVFQVTNIIRVQLKNIAKPKFLFLI